LFWHGGNSRSNVSAITAATGGQCGFGRDDGVSRAVCACSDSRVKLGPNSTMMADIHIHIIRPRWRAQRAVGLRCKSRSSKIQDNKRGTGRSSEGLAAAYHLSTCHRAAAGSVRTVRDAEHRQQNRQNSRPIARDGDGLIAGRAAEGDRAPGKRHHLATSSSSAAIPRRERQREQVQLNEAAFFPFSVDGRLRASLTASRRALRRAPGPRAKAEQERRYQSRTAWFEDQRDLS